MLVMREMLFIWTNLNIVMPFDWWNKAIHWTRTDALEVVNSSSMLINMFSHDCCRHVGPRKAPFKAPFNLNVAPSSATTTRPECLKYPTSLP